MNWTFFLLVIPMFLMMFLAQRNQKRSAQELQNKINNLSKGDEIVTIGGLFAVVDEVDLVNKKVVLDVDGVYLTYELYAIKRVVSKVDTEPVAVTQEETLIEE